MTLAIAGTDEELEGGLLYISRAADLWSLFDERRAEAIRRWIHDEWHAHEEDPDIQVYLAGRCKYLLDLLDGLDEGLRAEITDKHWRVDAATAARIKERYEWLVDSWEGEGGPVYTLANRVSEVHQLEWLLRRAVEMGRDVHAC